MKGKYITTQIQIVCAANSTNLETNYNPKDFTKNNRIYSRQTEAVKKTIVPFIIYQKAG